MVLSSDLCLTITLPGSLEASYHLSCRVESFYVTDFPSVFQPHEQHGQNPCIFVSSARDIRDTSNFSAMLSEKDTWKRKLITFSSSLRCFSFLALQLLSRPRILRFHPQHQATHGSAITSCIIKVAWSYCMTKLNSSVKGTPNHGTVQNKIQHWLTVTKLKIVGRTSSSWNPSVPSYMITYPSSYSFASPEVFSFSSRPNYCEWNHNNERYATVQKLGNLTTAVR